MNELAHPIASAALRGRAGEEFRRLGERVAREWQACGRAPARFVDIAAEALRDAAPWRGFDLGRLLAEVAHVPAEVRRPGAIFSDLPLIFYEDDLFRVELLIWTDSTTKVHDHGFSGAFALLQGSSLQCSYDFSGPSPATAQFALGSLLLADIALLKCGTVVEILPAPDFIHSAFHLESPTATLVIRTLRDATDLPQREYYAPNVAIASEPTDQMPLVTAEALAMLARIDAEAAVARIVEMAGTAPAETLFRTFDRIPWHTLDREPTLRAYNALLGRPEGSALLEALRRKLWVERLIGLRDKLTTAEQRLVLGGLAALDDRDLLIDLLAAGGVAEPEALVAECILAAAGIDGPTSKGDAAALRAALADHGRLPAEAAHLVASAGDPFARLFRDPPPELN